MTELKMTAVQQAHEALNTGAIIVFESDDGQKNVMPLPIGCEKAIDEAATLVARETGAEVWVYKPVSVYSVDKPSVTAKVL